MSSRTDGSRARCWPRMGWSLRELYVKFFGPGNLRICTDKPEPSHPCLNLAVVLIKNLGIALKLDTKHQLLPLFSGLDALRRKLCLRSDEANRIRKHILRNGIEDRARLVAERELASLISG